MPDKGQFAELVRHVHAVTDCELVWKHKTMETDAIRCSCQLVKPSAVVLSFV
jgi:hypothetical protein